MSENQIRRESIQTIKYLTTYFKMHYQLEAKQDAFEYGLEAFEVLVKKVETKEEARDFVYLTTRATYEEFVKVFEENYLDYVVDRF